MHWQLELWAGAREPQESSFDERSIGAFAAWLEEHGDWGWQVTPVVLGQAVEAALSVSSSVVLFPFEGLDGPRRVVLSHVIRSRT